MLAVIQNQLLKIILNKQRRFSTLLLYQQLKVLNIRQLFVFNVLKFLFKNKNKFNYLFHFAQTRSITGGNMAVPKMKNVSAQHHIDFIAPKIFNMLNAALKTINYLNPRNKKLLFAWIRENYNKVQSTFMW